MNTKKKQKRKLITLQNQFGKISGMRTWLEMKKKGEI